MEDAGGIVVAALIGYLAGTFPSADVVCRMATHGRVALRTAGSGNPGGLNAMQQIGTAWGIVVIVADMAKGVVAGVAGMIVAGDGGGYAAATASIGGHIFPVWSRFRGGKGVATSAGACLAVFPAYFPIDAVVAAVGAARIRNPERTIWVNCTVWVAAALAWWLADVPNLWGPAPAWGLLAFAAVGGALIAGKFRLAVVQARRPAGVR
jgi:acyl phosphate:glycerol-3-phosphate acyltransferase